MKRPKEKDSPKHSLCRGNGGPERTGKWPGTTQLLRASRVVPGPWIFRLLGGGSWTSPLITWHHELHTNGESGRPETYLCRLPWKAIMRIKRQWLWSTACVIRHILGVQKVAVNGVTPHRISPTKVFACIKPAVTQAGPIAFHSDAKERTFYYFKSKCSSRRYSECNLK